MSKTNDINHQLRCNSPRNGRKMVEIGIGTKKMRFHQRFVLAKGFDTTSIARFVYLHLKFKEHYKKMDMFSALLCVYQREGVSIPYYKLKYL